MEPTNSPNTHDANNRPPAHHGTGNGGRGEVVKALVDEGIVGETTGTIGMMKTTRGVNSVGASWP